jgi:hypothetical protein
MAGKEVAKGKRAVGTRFQRANVAYLKVRPLPPPIYQPLHGWLPLSDASGIDLFRACET